MVSFTLGLWAAWHKTKRVQILNELYTEILELFLLCRPWRVSDSRQHSQYNHRSCLHSLNLVDYDVDDNHFLPIMYCMLAVTQSAWWAVQHTNLKSFQITVDDVSSALIIMCHNKKIENAFMDQTAHINLLILSDELYSNDCILNYMNYILNT